MIPWWWIPVAFAVGYVVATIHIVIMDDEPKCKYFR